MIKPIIVPDLVGMRVTIPPVELFVSGFRIIAAILALLGAVLLFKKNKN